MHRSLWLCCINNDIGSAFACVASSSVCLATATLIVYKVNNFQNAIAIPNIPTNGGGYVFEESKNISKKEVEKNWEKIKLSEGKSSVLSGVPKTLPSLTKSIRIQKKASNSGFKFNSLKDSKNKIIEELKELNLEIKNNNLENIESEFGDLLFALINYLYLREQHNDL